MLEIRKFLKIVKEIFDKYSIIHGKLIIFRLVKGNV